MPQVSILVLLAYPDEDFLNVFKDKRKSNMTYIGGEAAINKVLERLKKLDPKLYEEQYGRKRD